MLALPATDHNTGQRIVTLDFIHTMRCVQKRCCDSCVLKIIKIGHFYGAIQKITVAFFETQ